MDSTIRVICKITVSKIEDHSLVSVNSNSAEDSKFRFLSNDKNITKTVLGFVTWPDANICQSGIMSSHKISPFHLIFVAFCRMSQFQD